jgi:hypothetical protein
VVRRWKGVFGDVVDLVHCNKKPCRNAPNSDVDNSGSRNFPTYTSFGFLQCGLEMEGHIVWFAPPLSTS